MSSQTTAFAAWAALGIAIYGAIVATLAAVTGLRSNYDRVRIRVTDSDGKRVRTLGEGAPRIRVAVANVGTIDAYVAEIFIVVRRKTYHLIALPDGDEILIPPKGRHVWEFEWRTLAAFEVIQQYLAAEMPRGIRRLWSPIPRSGLVVSLFVRLATGRTVFAGGLPRAGGEPTRTFYIRKGHVSR
jgi:hypothetical protein